jgi:hypothetical protein
MSSLKDKKSLQGKIESANSETPKQGCNVKQAVAKLRQNKSGIRLSKCN